MSTKFFTLSSPFRSRLPLFTVELYDDDDNETAAHVALTTISAAGSEGRRMQPKVRRTIAFQLPPVAPFTELRISALEEKTGWN